MFHSVYRTSDPVASQSAAAASREAHRVGTELQELRFEIERLLMITESLWSILKEKHNYTDAELEYRVLEIDMRDGKLDGKVARNAPVKCSKCGKALSRKRPRCLYCGQPAPPNLFGR